MKTPKVCKFEFTQLLPIGISLVALGIGLSYGLSVMGDVQDDSGVNACSQNSNGYTTFDTTVRQCYNGSDYRDVALSGTSDVWNATNSAVEGVAKIPDKMPLLVTVILASVIIGIIVTYLAGRMGGGSASE